MFLWLNRKLEGECISHISTSLAVECAITFSLFVSVSVFIYLPGNVPCPIVYGAVVDSACLVWEMASGERGACSLYDVDVFRKFYHGKLLHKICHACKRLAVHTKTFFFSKFYVHATSGTSQGFFTQSSEISDSVRTELCRNLRAQGKRWSGWPLG
jgi:hypothetical protein